MKNYTAEAYNKALGKVYFPDYENFIQKLKNVINKLAHSKTKWVKGNSQQWFDCEILESISLQDKLFKKFKHSKLNVDKEIYNKACIKLHSLILQKKREYFKKKLQENIAKPKDLWKTLKSLGLCKEFFSCSKKCISR